MTSSEFLILGSFPDPYPIIQLYHIIFRTKKQLFFSEIHKIISKRGFSGSKKGAVLDTFPPPEKGKAESKACLLLSAAD